jgi:signal transduction histidine kinase
MSAVEIAAVLVDRIAGRSGFRRLDDPALAVTDRRLFDLSAAKCPPSAEAASMSTPSNSQIVATFKAASRGASVAVTLGGCLVLVGWIFDIQILTTPCPEWVTVKANTALAFVLAGMTLWLLQGESADQWIRRIARIGASIVALLGLLVLSQYLIGWELGIDQLLVKDMFGGDGRQFNVPGRMAFVTALSFLLVGCALLLLDVKSRRGSLAAQWLALVVAALALTALTGYLYGVQSLYVIPLNGSIALYTVILFGTLAIGILFARSDEGLMAVVSSETAGGVMVRRLLPVAAALPIGLGLIRLLGQHAGLYGTEFGLSLMAVSSVIVLVSTVWWNGRSLFRADTARQQAEEVRHTLCDLGMLLSRSLRVEEVYPAFAGAVRTILPYDRLGILVPDGESLVMVHSVARPPLAAWEGAVFPAQGTSIEWVMAHKTPRIVKDLAVESVFTDDALIAREGVRSTLILPLLVGGEAVGAMVVDSRMPGVYGEAHVELLSLITEPLALSLQNARLFAQVTRHAEELEQQVEVRTRDLHLTNGKLAQASRHKSEFLAHMSHELRTPLNAILGFTELLQDSTFGPLTEKQVRYLSHVHTSGKHLLTLINDLLDLSKIEAGKLELRPEPFAIREALEGYLTDIQPLADQKRLTLALHADAAPITLTADPVRFKQIMYNLLSNAIKFTHEGGRVTVTARAVRCTECRLRCAAFRVSDTPSAVEIAVEDTGIGITAEDISKLFQRFTQLDSTFVKQSGGTGLGLALTKQLVELHGGQIWVTSEGIGYGSSFIVCLPLLSHARPEVEVR